MKNLVKGLALSGVAMMTAFGFSGAAAAQGLTAQSTMEQINGSGASGTAWVELEDNNEATFKVNMTGVTPGMPHAQHVHFGDITKSNNGPVTPPSSASDDYDADPTTTGNAGVDSSNGKAVPSGSQINFDNFINTVEGQPFYGSVQISLTTSGDTSPSSGLAVSRFPKGNSSGEYNYERTIQLTDKQVQAVKAGNVEIVVHGGDFWAPGDPDGSDGSILSYTYDANSDNDNDPTTSPAADVYPKSPLAAALGAGPLPLEATMPVAVGEFNAIPSGAVDTGLGEGATKASQMLIIGGLALAVAGTGTGLLYIHRHGEI